MSSVIAPTPSARDVALIEAAAGTAKEQVDQDLVNAKQGMETLLNRIVAKAVGNRDDPAVMDAWKKQRMVDFERSSRTLYALANFKGPGQLSWLLGELSKSTHPTMFEMKRDRRPPFEKKLKAKHEFKPNEVFFWDKTTYWRKDIKADLVKLQKLVWTVFKRSQERDTVLQSWFEALESQLNHYVAYASNADAAGIQAKYEICRITQLVNESNPPFFRPPGSLNIGSSFVIDNVLARVAAWPVTVPAATQQSLEKRRIGRRIAQIEGVPHYEAYNGVVHL